MGKTTLDFAAVRAQFFSDSHTFRHYNGGAEKQLLKAFASASDPNFKAPTYYVGDIIDFEFIEARMKKLGYTLDNFPTKFQDALKIIAPQPTEKESQYYTPDMYWQDVNMHHRFFDTMMFKGSKDQETILMGGNHDPGFFLLAGETINGITIKKEDIYTTNHGKKYDVEHGQEFDKYFLGENPYDKPIVQFACRVVDAAMEQDYLWGRKYESLEGQYFMTNAIKWLAKQSPEILPIFKRNADIKVQKLGLDGVICGHIHLFADSTLKSGAHYLNIGDGMTHGNSLAHMDDDNWLKVHKKNMPKSAKEILENVNPLERFRSNTQTFLQRAWEAELEHLHIKAAAKLSKKPSTENHISPQIA